MPPGAMRHTTSRKTNSEQCKETLDIELLDSPPFNAFLSPENGPKNRLEISFPIGRACDAVVGPASGLPAAERRSAGSRGCLASHHHCLRANLYLRQDRRDRLAVRHTQDDGFMTNPLTHVRTDHVRPNHFQPTHFQ